MDIEIQIKSGPLELLASGTLLAPDDQETYLTIKSNEDPLNLVFKFANSDQDPDQPRKEGRIVNNTTLEITFTNYKNILGSYNKDFWEIGTVYHRRLFFVYVIYGFGESKFKKIDYTFYLGEEVQNG